MEQTWRDQIEQLEHRIQRNLDTLRERNEQMEEVIRNAERRRSPGGGSAQQ